MGRAADAPCRQGQPALWLHQPCDLFGRADVAHGLSLAAAPGGIVEEAFAELGRRWKPILDVFDENGVNACYELHPGEDLHDGVTFERFLDAVDNHPRANILYDPSHFVLQQLDYLEFIDIYHERIKAFHVKDAEFRPNGRAGVYGSYSAGPSARGGSARWAMARSISAGFSRS